MVPVNKTVVLFFFHTHNMANDLQHNMDPVNIEPNSESFSHMANLEEEAHPLPMVRYASVHSIVLS
jgi:hypothetical protein